MLFKGLAHKGNQLFPILIIDWMIFGIRTLGPALRRKDAKLFWIARKACKKTKQI